MKLFLKRLLSIFLALIGILVLFHLIENWRGARAKDQWLKASISAGMPQTLEEMAPPKIPDAENFATHPAVADDLAGKPGKPGPVLPAVFSDGDLFRAWERGERIDLDALKTTLKIDDFKAILAPFETKLMGFEEASLRPNCRLMTTYGNEIPGLIGMRQRGRVLSLRAVIALRDGKSEEALCDILTILRVVKHLKQEPHLISQLLRIVYVRFSLQPIWEGLGTHRWNDQQLSMLQDALVDIDLLGSWRQSWIAESIFQREGMKQIAADPIWSTPYLNDSIFGKGRVANLLSIVFIPKGWIYQNLINVGRLHQAQFIDGIDPVHHHLDAREFDAIANSWSQSPRTPYTWLARLDIDATSQHTRRMGHSQSSLDQAFVACALERYFLAYRTYPERLDDLIPKYAAKLPVDIIDENLIRYRKASKTAYLLYSVGWNGTDEAGLVSLDSSKSPHHLIEQGDWVWMKPGS